MQDENKKESNGISNDPNVQLSAAGYGLQSANSRALIASKLVVDIDSYSVGIYRKDYKKRLGGSSIGEPCLQKLWLGFRWCRAETRPGRTYRLLDRGNREEPYTFSLLNGIGFRLFTHDPATNKQYTMSLFGGHFGGSLDAIGILPTMYGIETPMLISVKTSGTGAKFNNYSEKGVKLHEPRYYDQECIYGYAYNIKYAAWVVTNKNDDSIFIEIEELDVKRGQQLSDKAGSIIMSQVPMAKISKSPTAKECAYCTMKGVCHLAELPDKNCRSCASATPMDTPNPDGTPRWYCAEHKDQIPENVIRIGCDSYHPIINGR